MDDEIKCPYCGYAFDATETADHVTYHGDVTWDADCPSCDADLTVEEHVVRTWTVALKAEE